MKKGIAYEFLLKLIFAIILVLLVVVIFKGCFRLSDQGVQSFNELVNNVDEMSLLAGDALDSMPLRIDKLTYILAFNNEVDFISAIEINSIVEIFLRPTNCDKDKSCLCLCQECDRTWQDREEGETELVIEYGEEIDKQDINDFKYYSFHTGKMFCKEFDDVKFIEYANGKGAPADWKNPKGGSILQRNVEEPRLRTAYIEKYGDYIGICFEQPCISEEVKGQIGNE